MLRWVITFILPGLFMHLINAQPIGILQSLQEDEKSAIEAIALYPREERAVILNAVQHPEILVRMDHIRRTTEIQFQDMISGLSESDQQKLYNLTRYPDLMKVLGNREQSLKAGELDDVLKDFPEAIHRDAEFINRNYFTLIRDVHTLYRNADQVFEQVLDPYPVNIRDAYHQLTRLPGVISILTENMSLTVLLGDISRHQPESLDRELDSLSVVLAEQQSKELQAWKEELEANPEAMQEYEQAAQEFAAEQGYDDEPYSGPIPDRYTRDIYINYVWRPYPYWFGWPRWYEYECWYPYPWWYHWGFYYGPQNVIVIVGLPSHVFVHWHFHHYRHFYHYPHFTDHVIRHHYGPRGTGTSFRPVIREWEREHRQELPEDWLKDDKNRIERLRDYGKFRIDYENDVRQAVDKTPSTREYLEEHIARYPSLQPVLENKQQQSRNVPEKAYESDRMIKQDTYKPREKMIEPEKPTRQEEVDRAKEKHEKTWDQLKRQPQDKKPAPRTAPEKNEPVKSPPRTQTTRKEPVRTPTKTEPSKTEPSKRQPQKKNN